MIGRDMSIIFKIVPGFALLLFAIVSRAPFFNFPVIEWDEATFILLGQDLLNGNLPYTNLWDIKPPLLFYIMAVLDFLSNGDLYTLRLFGSIYTGAVLIVCYRLMLEKVSPIGAFAGTLFISYFVSMQYPYIGSEHIAMLFVILPVVILLKAKEGNLLVYSVTGALVCCAPLIRMNLALFSAFFGFYVFLDSYFRFGIKKSLMLSLFFILGASSVFAIVTFPYLVTGNFKLLIDSVFTASLSYAGSSYSMVEVFLEQLRFYFSSVPKLLFLISALFFLVSFMALKDFRANTAVRLVMLMLVAIEFSILKGGRWFNHYSIQVVPFAVIGFMWALNHLYFKFFSKELIYKSLLICFCVILIGITTISAKSRYKGLVASNNEISSIKAFLEKHTTSDDNIVFFQYHILAWLMGKEIVRPSLSHPSNVYKTFLLIHMPTAEHTIDSELDKIVKADAKYIVLSEWDYKHLERISSFVENYSLIKNFGSVEVYGRK